jgi:hypothetical protein
LILPIAPLTGRDQPVLGVEHFVQRHDFPTAALRTLSMRDDHYAHWYSPFLRGRDEPILRAEFAMDLGLSRQELLLIVHLTFSCVALSCERGSPGKTHPGTVFRWVRAREEFLEHVKDRRRAAWRYFMPGRWSAVGRLRLIIPAKKLMS